MATAIEVGPKQPEFTDSHLDSLCHVYTEFLEIHQLPSMCAEELLNQLQKRLHNHYINPSQCPASIEIDHQITFLKAFITIWDEVDS